MSASISSPAATPSQSHGLPGDSILVGTVYNIFHEEFATDEEFFSRVDRDIPAIAAAGFDTVLIFPMSEWDADSRSLRWTRTDHLVRRIEQSGLKFVPLLFKEEQAGHWFPIWKFRETGTWAARDRDNGNRNNRENVDFADPAVFPALESYFGEVIGRYRGSPALSFYNVWNEPHYSSGAPHVVARFRDWLKAKYGSLAALRRAWGDDFDTWEDVSPFLNDDWNSEMPSIDWTLFRGELNGILLGELAAVLRRHDATRPINANPVGTPFSTFSSFGGYDTDTWRFAPHQDFNGASYYPDFWARAQGLDRAPAWFHNLNFTVFRASAGANEYILTELYTHAKSGLTLGGYVDPATATQVAWTALANDCKGILWWKWDPFMRGRQSLGRGLVDINGELAPRGEAVSAFAHVLKRHGTLLRAARMEPPQVAIVVDMVGLLKVLQQTAEPRTQKFMFESIAGVFQALDSANVGVDILRADMGVGVDGLKRYRAIILPFQVVVRREFADALAAYVAAGGHVLADARTGTLDELDFAYAPSPGAGLVDLFGADRRDWIAEPRNFEVALAGGEVFAGRFFREELRTRPGVKVLGSFADDSSPAIIENRVGEGRAVLAAVPLGASYFEKHEQALAEFIVGFCESAGAVAPAGYDPELGAPPMLRVHTAPDGRRVVYAINEIDAPAAGTIVLPIGGATGANVTDLATDTPVDASIDGNTVRIRLELAPRGVAVIMVGK